MIVNHLKSQGLFDQFRRDCLADVDTKPAYQNLRQRVDNFVANHLATHTWSPHLNKNQLRNNIRQQVLKSGMLESGIDRIISQVVDPKINHTFRPQVEKAVHEFLATLNHREEAGGSAAPEEEKTEVVAGPQGVPAPGPSANVASDAMSILETITSLNQEASAARASTETAKGSERVAKKVPPQPSTETGAERERTSEDAAERDRPAPDSVGEGQEAAPKPEELMELPGPTEEAKPAPRESTVVAPPSRDVPQESSDQKTKSADKGEKKQDGGEKERKKEKKEKTEKKSEHSRRSDELLKGKDEKQAKEKEGECSKLPTEKNSNKPKEDGSLMDSDVDGLTDITVSSVHTSDLSSFEEDTEEEVVLSDSMEEGEITSDDEQKSRQGKAKPQGGDPGEVRARSVRQAYVHKPYLYSKYYSDSDDELTVEQRRQSIAKEKEERLLRRQINREKLEEKRKQKAEKTKSSKAKSQGKSNVDPEEAPKSLEPKAPGIKEVLKERKVLEKKVALSKKRKKDSRNVEENSKKKPQSEEDSKETLKAIEHCEKEKASSSKDSKHVSAKSEPSKPARRLSECLHSADENRNEREHKRRTSTPVLVEAALEETDSRDGKRPVESSDASSEESQKQRGSLKSEKHPKKEDSDTPPPKSLPRKEAKSSSKDKPEKEKTLADDKASAKHKYKGDESEPHSEKSLRVEESSQKQSQQARLPSDEKAERKSKHRNERKLSVLGKDGKPVSEYIIKTDENVRKENKKERHAPTEKTKAEHRSRRLSDTKIQKDSLSSRQHGTPLQRRSESYSEDRCETDGTNLDSYAKPEEAEAKKEKRRTKSLTEEKATLKFKSKGQGKLSKGAETELQESASRQPASARTEKERSAEESDPDRQRKSKMEDKLEEAGAEPAAESSAALAHGTQKESSHRAKGPLAKEKYKGEKDSSASRTERKSSDGHKSRSLKHSSKDVRKKEENRSDEKDAKEGDGNHEKARGNSSGMEKKLSRRLSENRRGSLSQEVTRGEEKPSVNTPGASSLQRPKKSGGEATLIPEQEPMETDSELATENVSEACKPQDGGSSASQPDTDSENAAKQKVAATLSKEELKTVAVDANTGAPASKSKHGTGLAASSEKHVDQKTSQTKKGHTQSVVPRQHPGEREAAQPGAEELGADPQAGPRVFPRASTGNGRIQKSVRNTTRPTEERVSSRETAPEHPTGVEGSSLVGSVAPAPQTRSLDTEVIPLSDRRPGRESGRASASRLHHCETPNPNWPVGELEVPGTQDSKEGAVSTGETPAKVGTGSRGHAPEKRQAASVPSKQGKVGTSLGGELTGSVVGNENAGREGGSVGKAERKRDWNPEPGSEQTVQATVENGGRDRVAVDHVVGTGDGGTVGHRGSTDPREAGSSSAEAGGQNDSSEVGTSAATNTATPGPHQANGEAGSVPNGRVGTEKTPVATSTEGETKDAAFKPAKAGDASTTSLETGAGELAAPCTSIEADEGMVAGACSVPLVGTVFAAAEEGGAVVTEGRAGSETVLTSTKEGDSGACSTAESMGRAEEPTAARPVAVEDQGVEVEEKDDAVTSAGSEDKCDASSGRDSERAAGTAAFNSEGESDGAVTSAGTEIRAGSASSDEGDESQRGATRMGTKKETEGTVTCTGAGRGGETLVMCAVAGAGPPEELMVTGAAEGPVDDNEPQAPGATPEPGGPTHDGAEGESAVTSTGITEDNEGPATCTGLGAHHEGFPHGDSAMDSTAAQEVSAVPGVAAGQCDDEGVVTSTGAKEEDEEDEGVVTSTGRGNDIGHGPTCTGAEEESEGAVVCESAGGPGRVVAAAGLVEAGATRESRVDSVSGTEKEAKDPEVGSSAKGVVGSSVTSAVKGDSAGDAVGAEGPMTSTAPGKRDSQLSTVGTLRDTAVSTGLVGGSCEVLMSRAAPACDAGDMSPGEKEDEGAITSADNEDGGGPSATLHHDSAASQVHTAGGRAPDKGLAISTSAAQLGQMARVEKGTCAARSEQREGPGGSLEEFEAPMPSAVSGAEDQTVTLRSEEKDECAMISTSIAEDSDTPISSATVATCTERQPPGATAGDQADGLALVSTQDFEAPMPSAPAEPGNPLAAADREEKDEYALISTSIAEGCEAAVLGGGLEEKDGSAIISTSSGEDADGPVSSAVPREPSAMPTEDVSEAPVISTSTSEGCEAATREAARQDVPAAQRGEDAADVAVISTSTAECVARGHEEGGKDPPAAGNSSQLPVTAGEVGSVGAGEAQEGQRRPSAGGGPPSAEEKHSREPQSEGRVLPSTPEKVLVGTVQREPGALWDSSLAALVGSGSSTGPVRGEHRAAVDASAPRAGDTPPISAAAAEKPTQPPAQQGAGSSGKTTAESSVGQEAAAGRGPPEPSAARRAELAVKSEPRGTVTRPVPEEADLRVAVCPKEAVSDAGNEEAPLTVSGGSEQKTAVRPEPCAPSEAERKGGSPTAGVAPVRGAAELQSNNPLADASLSVGNPGSPAAEEVQDRPCDRGAETSGAGRGDPHAEREPSAGSDSKVDEEEQLTPKRKRRRLCPSWEDELDDALDILDPRGETQRPCSETEPRDSRVLTLGDPRCRTEENSGDLDESCKASSKASSTASGPLEEKDEYSSGEAAGEKAEANDDDGTKAQEEDQPIVIKRKRGRPRKYPVDTPSRLKEDSRVDPGTGAVEPSPPGSKPRTTQTDEPSREAASLQDRSGSNDEEETAVASARRRGRKPKRLPVPSDDAESSEPERKRQKSVSETAEDKKDQESEEDEEEEGEEEEEEQPTGATTRSTTRSEAQRSKAQLSPSAKRRREGSPPGARTRGQQRVEEAPAKKAKR